MDIDPQDPERQRSDDAFDDLGRRVGDMFREFFERQFQGLSKASEVLDAEARVESLPEVPVDDTSTAAGSSVEFEETAIPSPPPFVPLQAAEVAPTQLTVQSLPVVPEPPEPVLSAQDVLADAALTKDLPVPPPPNLDTLHELPAPLAAVLGESPAVQTVTPEPPQFAAPDTDPRSFLSDLPSVPVPLNVEDGVPAEVLGPSAAPVLPGPLPPQPSPSPPLELSVGEIEQDFQAALNSSIRPAPVPPAPEFSSLPDAMASPIGVDDPVGFSVWTKQRQQERVAYDPISHQIQAATAERDRYSRMVQEETLAGLHRTMQDVVNLHQRVTSVVRAYEVSPETMSDANV